ncbi:MAG: Gfo/Idh/MocA family oxidoreductase [Firmicutes bacterium]|nr:Gfo/Idh/MocA family oxidoreductase [Bacillota bacterium]
MVKVAVVGSDRWNQQRVEWLKSFSSVNVSTVVDEGGVEGQSLNYERAVVQVMEEVDAMVLSVPSDQCWPLLAVLAPFDKPILLDKPQGLNVEEAKELYHLVQQFGNRVTVGRQWRWLPEFQEMKRCLTAGDIGKALCYVGIRRYGTRGPMSEGQGFRRIWSEIGLDDVELALWFLGEAVDWVEAVETGGWISGSLPSADVQESVGVIHFCSGALGYLACGRLAWRGVDIRSEIWGESGALAAEFSHASEVVRIDELGQTVVGYQDYSEVLTMAMREETKTWLQSVIAGSPPLVSMEEMWKALQVTSALNESVQSGTRVYMKITDQGQDT